MSLRIPPPIASTVVLEAPTVEISSAPRIADPLLALQRRARHLEQQLQELLDAQADGLADSEAGNKVMPDDLISNGSATPTVSSIRGSDRNRDNEEHRYDTSKKVGLNAARKGISRRIHELASVKSEELDLLDESMRHVQTIVERTHAWRHKRSRLEKKIKDMEGNGASSRAQMLQAEAIKLKEAMLQKEEELRALQVRHRRVQDDLAAIENSAEASLSTYKASLSILDHEIASFLARPSPTNHAPLSPTPFFALPANRRTLEMANEYWADEHARLSEKCQEVDIDCAALDEGALLWSDVINKVVGFEASLQSYMQPAQQANAINTSQLLDQMDATISFLEAKVDHATSRGWNLLVCAVGAELEAFKQGKDMLEEALGVRRAGDGALPNKPAQNDVVQKESGDETMSRSAIRNGKQAPPRPPGLLSQPKFFDTDDEDPDPELMISQQED